MSALPQPPAGSAPEWLVAEMPPGYKTRFAEIQRLSTEIHAMDRIGRLLWEIGPALTEAVLEVCASLKLETESTTALTASLVGVKLDGKRRLLIHVANADGIIQKKSAELAHVFRILHEVAGGDDRVVLIVNSDRATRPKDRTEAIAPDALSLLARMGANVLTAPTLFALWMLSLQDQNRARAQIGQLHAQDGGAFLPATLAG